MIDSDAPAMINERRCPTRSHNGPVNGADTAQEMVSNPRNQPADAGVPPRASIRYGATGNSWNTEVNTRKLKTNMVRKRGVTSGGVIHRQYRRSRRHGRGPAATWTDRAYAGHDAGATGAWSTSRPGQSAEADVSEIRVDARGVIVRCGSCGAANRLAFS